MELAEKLHLAHEMIEREVVFLAENYGKYIDTESMRYHADHISWCLERLYAAEQLYKKGYVNPANEAVTDLLQYIHCKGIVMS